MQACQTPQVIPPKDGEPLDTWDYDGRPYILPLPLGRMSSPGTVGRHRVLTKIRASD